MTIKALQRFKNLHVLVAVPSTGTVHTECMTSMVQMFTYCLVQQLGDYKTHQIRMFSTKGSILPNQRWEAIKSARKNKCDYVLWIDSDQSFPKDTLHRLIAADKDVIGANVATKTMPTLPTARKFDPSRDSGALVWTPEGSEELEQVWRLGCGITLMNKKAINALRDDCFKMFYRPEVDRYQGEDWSMCEQLEAAGIEIWVDHGLSNEIGHIGHFNYTHAYNGEVVRGEQECLVRASER